MMEGILLLIKRSCLFLIILTIIGIFTFITCETFYFYTNLVPHTTEPVYENSIESNTIEIIAMGFDWNSENTIFSFLPSVNFDEMTTYTVIIRDSAKSSEGVTLKESFILSFTTLSLS